MAGIGVWLLVVGWLAGAVTMAGRFDWEFSLARELVGWRIDWTGRFLLALGDWLARGVLVGFGDWLLFGD